MNYLINRLYKLSRGLDWEDQKEVVREAADLIEQLEFKVQRLGAERLCTVQQLTEAKKVIDQLVESLGICLAEISAWRVESYCDDFNSPDVNEALAAAKQFRERNV